MEGPWPARGTWEQGDFWPWRNWGHDPKDGQCEGPPRPGDGLYQFLEGEEELVTGMVLVVEDEMKLRDLVRSFLEREGFTVLNAATGGRGAPVRGESHARPGCPRPRATRHPGRGGST